MVQMLSQEASGKCMGKYPIRSLRQITPLDPSLFPLTAGVRMARTDVVAARIW